MEPKRLNIPFIDFGSRSFRERIIGIGNKIRELGPGKIVGVIVDDKPGNVDNYINAMAQAFPDIGLNDRREGPVPKVILLRFKINHTP